MEILDEGFESGRIQQKGHGRLAGFEFLVGYDDHQREILFDFVRAEISAKMFPRDKRRCSNEQWIEVRQGRYGVC